MTTSIALNRSVVTCPANYYRTDDFESGAGGFSIAFTCAATQ